MWDDQKRQRFQLLRQREQNLSVAEQAELASLVQELEAAEATYLKPATEKVRQDTERMVKQNDELNKLIDRKRNLVERLDRFLVDARTERHAIESDLAAVLAGSRGSDMEE